MVEVNFRKGLWALDSRNPWPSGPGLARLTPPCMAMMRRKKEGCECMQFVRPFDCPYPPPANRRWRRGQKEPREITCRDRAIEAEALVFPPPPASEGNGNGVARYVFASDVVIRELVCTHAV